MISTQGFYGVRSDWACHINNVFQRVVDDALDGDPTHVGPAVDRLKSDLPAPMDGAESLILRQSLTLFLDRFARVVHQRFHRNFDPYTCTDAPPTDHEQLWMVSESIKKQLDDWCTTYTRWFDAVHEVPIPLRVRRILEERFSDPITVREVANRIACSESVLRREFKRMFGLTPSEYLARIRIRNGLCRLRNTTDSVEAVARWAGYRSDNKFRKRVQDYTGLRPSEVRALDEPAFADLLALRLPCGSGCQGGPACFGQTTMTSGPHLN